MCHNQLLRLQLKKKLSSQVNRNTPINILILLICIGFAFYIGTWFTDKDKVPSQYKYKYDSLTFVVKTQKNIMTDNQLIKISLQQKEKGLKYKEDSIAEAGEIQKIHLEAKRKELSEKWRRSSENEIAEEMTSRFKQAHPAPLFDTSKDGDVIIGKNVSIHFLERDEEVEAISKELKAVDAQLSFARSRISNFGQQLQASRVDSIALSTIIASKESAIFLNEREKIDSDKKHKKELNKQKVQKWVSVVVAGVMTYLAISN